MQNIPNNTPGRGDLIRLMLGGDILDQGAELIGYKRKKEIKEKAAFTVTGSASYTSTPKAPVEKQRDFGDFFYVVTKYTPKERAEDSTPVWFKEAVPFIPGEENQSIAPDYVIPPRDPWSRIWPIIKKALGERMNSTELDGKKAVEMITAGEVIKDLPFQKRNTWAPEAWIILNRSRERAFFWDEETRIVEHIIRLRGKSGLTVLEAADGPWRCWHRFKNDDALSDEQAVPAPGMPVFLIGPRGNEWLQWGQKIAKITGIIPYVFTPEKGFSSLRYYSGDKFSKEIKADEIRKILSLLSISIWTEPLMLHEVCTTFIKKGGGYEQDIINHPHTLTSSGGLMIREEYRSYYWRNFVEDTSRDEKERMMGLIKKHHRTTIQLTLETGLYEHLTGQKVEIPEFKIISFKKFMARCARTQEDPHYPEKFPLKHWIKTLTPLLPETIWRESKEASSALLIALKEEILEGQNIILPPEVNPGQYPWIFRGEKQIRGYRIHQFGGKLQFEPTDIREEEQVASLYEVILDSKVVIIETKRERKTFNPGTKPFKLEKESIKLQTNFIDLTLSPLPSPPWGTAIGRDTYGLWAEFTLKGITQRLRWINPGEFLMGSPEDEPEREKNEKQHKVIMIEGFWMGDTACTQELWEAVMGKNPSSFKGARRPVENVSWEDCHEFLKKLNKAGKGLIFSLPTEARWEYACRAGTTTPFSFGENITPEQVNYDGNHPYNNVFKGKNRKETVEVKSLSPNRWGLYEMHGNVDEWCEDWFGDYADGEVTNPDGPEAGVGRVMRGGGWNDVGWGCRSACRDWSRPDFRDYFQGFRLSARSYP